MKKIFFIMLFIFLVGILLVFVGAGCKENIFGKAKIKEAKSEVDDKIKDKYLEAPAEIKEKYTQDGEKLKMIAKNNPKDMVEVEVGGDTEFEPKVKIKRWDEVSLAIKLKENEIDKTNIDFEGNKIKWKKGNKEVHMYDLPISEEHPEGAYEIEAILNEIPDTNVVEFEIETDGLKFFYQPELTEQEIEDGAKRPEHIVGSYAVYTSEDKINWKGGKEYKVGKVGHIYRPKIIDANGDWVWGELNITGNTLSVTMDDNWKNNAVYPVMVDPTFGYTTDGGSSQSIEDDVRGSVFTGAVGTVTEITASLSLNDDVRRAVVGAYLDSDDSLVSGSQSEQVVGPLNDFHEFTDPEFSVSAVDYILVAFADRNFSSLAYDTGDTNQGYKHDQSTGYPNLPASVSWTNDNNKYSIYATYTAGAPASTPAVITGGEIIILRRGR